VHGMENMENQRNLGMLVHGVNPIIRRLVIRIANYPDRLGPSVEHETVPKIPSCHYMLLM